MMPVHQRCPKCRNWFWGSDAIGSPCMSCESRQQMAGNDEWQNGITDVSQHVQVLLSTCNPICHKSAEIIRKLASMIREEIQRHEASEYISQSEVAREYHEQQAERLRKSLKGIGWE